ncbi:MAG TPA: 3-oxoadipate enol-lactonase [Terracidiphilus sp.]|jgi:3-oxoadipate enol-lactonase
MPFVDSNDARIHYQLTGPEQAPVIVLIHSLGANLHMWDPLVAHLGSSFRHLRYDLPGHGESSIPAVPYGIDQLGSDLVALLDHLGVAQANICGLSIGGLIAMWLGLYAPARVRKLILANTAARIGSVASWEQRIEQVEREGMAALAQTTPERWFTEAYRRAHPEEMAAVSNMVAATNRTGYLGCCAVLRDTDLSQAIAAITKPTLVITGTHDTATPLADGRNLWTAIAGSRLVELGTSHISAWERPEQFAQVVTDFLNSKEPHHG